MTHSFWSSIYLDFYQFHKFIREDKSVHLFLKNENWIKQTVNLLAIELQLRVRGSNNIIITFKKESLKNLIFSLKPGLKPFSGANIGQVCRRPVFHNLDLPPS